MQLRGTYYVEETNGSSASITGFDELDVIGAVSLFLAWIGVFMRYGFTLPAFVFVILFTLLVVSGAFDRRSHRISLWLSFTAVFLWLVTVCFMPYGIGPRLTSLGAGSLVPVFVHITGVGFLPVLLDGIIGAVVAFVVGVAAVFVGGLLTGSRVLSSATFITGIAVGLFLGTTGVLVAVAFMCVMLLILALVQRVVLLRKVNGMLVPPLYTSELGRGGRQGAAPIGLALALAVIVILVVL